MDWEPAKQLLLSKAAEDRIWAYLELQQDLVFPKLAREQRWVYAAGALELGAQWAADFKGVDLLAAVGRRGLVLTTGDLGQRLRAAYAPGSITINRRALERICQALPAHFLTYQQLERATIAHEFFHALEEERGCVDRCFPAVTIWKLGPWRVRTARVRAVREIAAHRFAKELAALPCLPIFLDWFLLAESSPDFRSSLPQLIGEVEDLLKNSAT